MLIHEVFKRVSLIVAFCAMQAAGIQVYAQGGGVGADGLTFEERRQRWLNNLPSPRSDMSMELRRRYLLSWLEEGVYNDVVSEAIQDFVTGYWLGGIRAQGGFAVMILLKYGGLISPEDAEAIHDRYLESIQQSEFFTHRNPNKQVYAMVGTYLYTEYFDKSLEFPIYGYPTRENPNSLEPSYENSWPEFSANGRNYDFGGGPYKAHQLARDWLMWAMDTWYVKAGGVGPREFDSIDYSRAFVGSMALLWSFTPSSDPKLKRMAKMATDLMLLDSVLDFSANSWGGTMGRADFRWMERSPIFPMHIFWGMGEDADRFDVRGHYEIGYVPPEVIIDVGVLKDEPDRYWHFHKEYNGNWLLQNPDFGKWNWVTKYYNMGSNVGAAKQGWQVNVRGPGRRRFIRFWINEDAQEPPLDQEASYLGTHGRQFRNAIFADIGTTPHLWEKKVDVDWDIQESEDGWLFKKLDRSMVAIGLAATSASVEVAIEGVDYESWTDFKQAVKNNARLTTEYYITSRNVKINRNDYCGLNEPGDCRFPFKRMETIDHNGDKIVSWNNGVMTVTRHGRTMVYDFNNWTYRSESEPPDTQAPAPPTGVKVDAAEN